MKDRLVVDLGGIVNGPTELLKNSSYGSLEEGGDVALFSLVQVDCDKLASQFGTATPARVQSRYFDTFAEIGVKIDQVHHKVIQNDASVFVEYILDPVSCVLYRGAHFE